MTIKMPQIMRLKKAIRSGWLPGRVMEPVQNVRVVKFDCAKNEGKPFQSVLQV